jgi:hypothetical protein
MNRAPSDTADPMDVVSDITMNRAQARFVRYFTAILIDLVVLNLFAEHWEAVYVSNFTITLAAAVLLQALLKLTMAIEHRVAGFWNARPGGFARFMRYFSAWLILFGSKFLILWAVDLAFAGNIAFHGAAHGVLAIIVVLVVMVLAELVAVRMFNWLGARR